MRCAVAKNSEYNRELRAKKLDKLKELQQVLPSYVQPYLDGMRVGYQPNTLVAYARDLITFFEYLKEMNPSFKDLEIKQIPLEILDELSIQDIIEYKNYLSYNNGENKHSNQASSIERRLAPLRGFYVLANDMGFLHNNPTISEIGQKRNKANKKEIVYMAPDEVHRFLDVTENTRFDSDRQKKYVSNLKERDTALLTLLLNTGIRVSECVGIDLSDLNFNENSVKVFRKGGYDQTVYFNERTAEALKTYIDGERKKYCDSDTEKALFLSSQKKRIQVRSVEYMVKKYAAQALPGKKLTPHKMRSTYGTALYDETSDIRLVADVLGHEDVTTTARHYASMKERHRKEAGTMDLYQDTPKK